MSSERDRSSGVEAGDLLGASGQTIGDGVRDGQIVERARGSLDLDDIPPDEAARLVAAGRRAVPPHSPR